MTCIAWDGKILAADRRADNGIIYPVTKIIRHENILLGGAGRFYSVRQMFDWVINGSDSRDFPEAQKGDDFASILMIRDSKIWLFESSPCPIRVEQDFFAIGSGKYVAIGVLHCGKSAIEAVQIASLYDNGCGNGHDFLSLN